MPSVSARRKTREFGVVKGVDGARVLRSGRRVLTESVEKKLKEQYDRDEWFTTKTKNTPKDHGNKENGWTNGTKLKKQELPRIRNILVRKNTPKIVPKTGSVIEPKRVANESFDDSGERNNRFGIVYSRKRKRVDGLEKEETLEGKRYRLQFSRRQRSNEILENGVVSSSPELSIVVCGGSPRSGISGGFPCFLHLVLRYINRASLEVSELAAFLMSEPLCSVFASSGIHFVKDFPSDGTGICKFFASEHFVPMLSVNFSAIPLCFANIHHNLWFRCLSVGPVINSLDKHEWDEIMGNMESDGSCIPMNVETIQEKIMVLEVDHSRSMHPSIRASKLAARNTSYKNGLNSRGIRKRRSSVRGRKARSTSLVGMHHKANGALVSDLISSRKNGIPFSSVVSKNKLRSSIRGRSASSLKGVSSTVLAVTRGMDLSMNKLWSSVQHSCAVNLKNSDTTTIGVTQDMGMSSCSANMLVIDLDRCSRIKDATILLETSDSGECMLVVKKDGSARYTHLAQKVMKPCTSNRFTHDILWSVDENLKLEFPSRQDWLIFKDLYKECYDRNVPASASKAIPVPVVREVFGNEGGVPSFSRPSAYICSTSDELTRALAKRTANYDMDSEDEEWLKKLNDEASVETDHLSEDKFELMIDSFERAFYCSVGEFSDETMINQCLELGRKDVVEAVYCYWMKKRKQKRAPLLRVFQANQAKKVPQIPKPVLRKRRSFNRQASQSGRGKQPSVLLAMAAEQEALEEQNALLKVEAVKASAKKAIELAIAKRRRAQLLMGNADLAIYKAITALEIAEAAQSWTHDACTPCD